MQNLKLKKERIFAVRSTKKVSDQGSNRSSMQCGHRSPCNKDVLQTLACYIQLDKLLELCHVATLFPTLQHKEKKKKGLEDNKAL